MYRKEKLDNEWEQEYKKWRELGGNNTCLCGSNKKFKGCCKNNWYATLTAKFN